MNKSFMCEKKEREKLVFKRREKNSVYGLHRKTCWLKKKSYNMCLERQRCRKFCGKSFTSSRTSTFDVCVCEINSFREEIKVKTDAGQKDDKFFTSCHEKLCAIYL